MAGCRPSAFEFRRLRDERADRCLQPERLVMRARSSEPGVLAVRLLFEAREVPLRPMRATSPASAQTLIKKSKLVLLANEIDLRLCFVCSAISFLLTRDAMTEAR
jgi:hypothetical protein